MFAIPHFAFTRHIRRTSEIGPCREHCVGNRPVTLQGEQKIGRSGSIMRGAEDFVFVLFQNIDPRADICGMLLGIMRNFPFRCQKNAG